MYTRKEIAAARKLAKQNGVNSLLSDPKSNPKTEKNSKRRGILTAPLHLAPDTLSGYQVCPRATPACRALCLHTAGNPNYLDAKEKARIARTRFFFQHREAFMTLLWAELTRHEKRATERNMFCGVRPNATSDIAWEAYRFTNGQSIFETFPNTTFYDYTKVEKRMCKFLEGHMPSNYYLTFSATESNWDYCESVLNKGGTVAVPFNTKRGQPMIAEYRGFPVVDADIDDYRPADPKGCIAGLRAKGKAIGDKSGFVHEVKPVSTWFEQYVWSEQARDEFLIKVKQTNAHIWKVEAVNERGRDGYVITYYRR